MKTGAYNHIQPRKRDSSVLVVQQGPIGYFYTDLLNLMHGGYEYGA